MVPPFSPGKRKSPPYSLQGSSGLFYLSYIFPSHSTLILNLHYDIKHFHPVFSEFKMGLAAIYFSNLKIRRVFILRNSLGPLYVKYTFFTTTLYPCVPLCPPYVPYCFLSPGPGGWDHNIPSQLCNVTPRLPWFLFL